MRYSDLYPGDEDQLAEYLKELVTGGDLQKRHPGLLSNFSPRVTRAFQTSQNMSLMSISSMSLLPRGLDNLG
jgi:hypothetical protein